jgi:hypothetical protein
MWCAGTGRCFVGATLVAKAFWSRSGPLLHCVKHAVRREGSERETSKDHQQYFR